MKFNLNIETAILGKSMVKGIDAGIGLTSRTFKGKIRSFEFILREITSDTWKWMKCKTKLKISNTLQK